MFILKCEKFLSTVFFFFLEKKICYDQLQIDQLQIGLKIAFPKLDATVISSLEDCDSEGLWSLELCTREYIHKIHARRVVALKRIS